MSWRDKVRLRDRVDRPPILHLEPGEHVLTVVEEPDRPIATRYGLRLPIIVNPIDSKDRYTWLVAWSDETGRESLLGQLKAIADRHGGLKGLRLSVTVQSVGGRKRYQVKEIDVQHGER